MENKRKIRRRDFLRKLGIGALGSAAMMTAGPLLGFTTEENERRKGMGGFNSPANQADSMTYRINRHTGDKVSLLGYGCMRWPSKPGTHELDQDKINELVDYAMAHGVNYYDTAPAYGDSEIALGKAIHKYPRKSYLVATKMSNFNPKDQTREGSIAMYNNSFKRIQVDYFDYYLLHGIGMGGMKSFNERFINNGILDFLLNERKEGRIRNLGFSYHGDIAVFDYLLKQDIKWDFVQIELNYVDWKHAREMNPRNTDAEYLYNELDKRNIQAVIMEPLLGGRLANLNQHLADKLKAQRPNDSIASWAFRYAGTMPGTLTVLSGMSIMDHLKEDLHLYSPLDPCTSSELALLDEVANVYCRYPMIPCTGCKYCMPCPFGVDIPGNFAYYNKHVNEGTMPNPSSPDYKQQVKEFLDGYDKALSDDKKAYQCQSCNNCVSHCPQHIRIPNQMHRISKLIDEMKKVVG